MNNLFSSVQSFFHSVTTTDRYASYESQYRSSSNARSGSSRQRAPINSTNGEDEESRVTDGDGFTRVGFLNNSSSQSLNGSSTNLASRSSASLSRMAYTPGMRSQQIGNGGIALQEYADGIPPPPPPALSWKRIDRWVEANYPELYDQLSEPVTSADLNELESDLDCTLPLEVRDSYMIHDGQERGGRPTGLFFGVTVLDVESIMEEWGHWKNTAVRLNNMAKQQQQRARNNSAASSSSSSSAAASAAATAASQNGGWINRQESVPEGAIQRVYAHPAWIPLAKDFEGNNIAVDLSPGKTGRWGQVILFGRDFDRKYVIAPSWAHFLHTFADDLEGGDHLIDEDIENGVLMFRAPNGRIIPYFDILRSRVERVLRQARKANQPAPRSRPASRPSSRPVSPALDKPPRTLSSPRLLISPMQSSTNLPATRLSGSTTSVNEISSEPKKVSPPDAPAKVIPENTSEEPVATPEEPAAKEVGSDDKKSQTGTTVSEIDDANDKKPEDAQLKGKEKSPADDSKAADDKDEVDLLEDEMADVEI